MTDKRVQGDASETGVIRFVEGVLVGGEHDLTNGIETERELYPIFSYID